MFESYFFTIGTLEARFNFNLDFRLFIGVTFLSWTKSNK